MPTSGGCNGAKSSLPRVSVLKSFRSMAPVIGTGLRSGKGRSSVKPRDRARPANRGGSLADPFPTVRAFRPIGRGTRPFCAASSVLTIADAEAVLPGPRADRVDSPGVSPRSAFSANRTWNHGVRLPCAHPDLSNLPASTAVPVSGDGSAPWNAHRLNPAVCNYFYNSCLFNQFRVKPSRIASGYDHRSALAEIPIFAAHSILPRLKSKLTRAMRQAAETWAACPNVGRADLPPDCYSSRT